ncbi:MAG TPA: ABC transporter permease [Vicinamibacterales bacterium]|nr:ABC transporter permease [Vicinamibacterales bacterium]
MFRRLWFFVTRWRRIQDLDEEMRLHVELRAAANRRDGLRAAEARRQALLRFGNPLKLREEARDVWGFAELERVGGDLRQAVRRVVQHPARTLVVVLTLALGVGATTAMFTLVDAMLLRPAPWNTSGRVVWIVGFEGRSAGPRNLSYPDYLGYRDRATTLSGVAAEGGTAMVIGSRQPQRVLGGIVSGNYFDVLGLHAQVGRTFAPDEDAAPGAYPVVVLSDGLWTGQFGADPGVIGTRVAINGQPFTIIGVAPRGFTGAAFATNPYQLWVPMAMQGAAMPRGAGRLIDASQAWLLVVGRLRDGVTAAEADAEARVIARQMHSPRTPADQEKSARALPMRGGLSPWEQESLAPVFGLVSIVPALVLLVACANAANVLMAHHTARRREFAMRRAVGAFRGRLVRQLVAESFVLALLAGLAGFGASFVLSALIVHFGGVPSDVSALLALDGRALLAATAVAVGAVVLFGIAPALTTTRFDVVPVLKDEGTTSTASRGSGRLRRDFVVAQVAPPLTLLVTTGLFFQSLLRAMRVDPGFDPNGLATVSFDLDLQGYAPDRRAAFAARFIERASALPDVTSVAAADILPLGGEMYGGTIVSDNGASSSRVSVAHVSSRYFETLGLPIVRGRAMTPAEVAANAPVAIVNETLARSVWPGVDPLGRQVRPDGANEPWREVVGIARDAKYLFLTESPLGAYYAPLPLPSGGTFVIRATGSPRAALASMTDIARDLDPQLPIATAQTMEERIRRTVTLRRAVVSLLSVLGALTLLLASVGIYGVAGHSVSMRTREVGIRISLGARASDVLRMIIRENLSLSLFGVAIGLGISAVTATMLASYLFGVTAADPATFAGSGVILCLVSLVASYLPARRAARLDPLLALRRE